MKRDSPLRKKEIIFILIAYMIGGAKKAIKNIVP